MDGSAAATLNILNFVPRMLCQLNNVGTIIHYFILPHQLSGRQVAFLPTGQSNRDPDEWCLLCWLVVGLHMLRLDAVLLLCLQYDV